MRLGLLATLLAFLALPAHAQSYRVSELVEGFERAVFGSEFGSRLNGTYLRRFDKPVRVYVSVKSRNRKRGRAVQRFVRMLNARVKGLSLVLTADPARADFEIFVVDRSQYSYTVQARVFRQGGAPVRGRCMVRSVFTRTAGIVSSAAVIVSNEGERLFNRCLAEEFMQGLGPLNDDRRLKHSMFNDTSGFTRATRFDLLILNMLYDPRLRSGMTPAEARPLLPALARAAMKRLPPSCCGS